MYVHTIENKQAVIYMHTCMYYDGWTDTDTVPERQVGVHVRVFVHACTHVCVFVRVSESKLINIPVF